MKLILIILTFIILSFIASCIITDYNWRRGAGVRLLEEARYNSADLLVQALIKYRSETGRLPDSISEVQATYDERYMSYQASNLSVLPFTEIAGYYNPHSSKDTVFTWPGEGKDTRNIWITKALKLHGDYIE